MDNAYHERLTPYGVAVRYPGELNLEDRHAETAIQYACALLDWAKGQCVEAERSEEQP